MAVTIPVGHLDVVANIGPLSRDGWGFGDITTRAQLGWQQGDFSHLVYVQAVAPTARWQPGFTPIIGLHRPGVDTGWAWEHKPAKLQLNGQTSPRSARHRSQLAAISWAKRTKAGCSMPGLGQAGASAPPQHPRPRADRCWRHLPLLDLTVFADANRMHQSPELASADRGCADKNRQHP